MVSNTSGSDGAIEIVAGDSNFVDATKLLGAVADPGADPETLRPLDQVAQFTGVESREVMVNGQAIAIDAENDSLTMFWTKQDGPPSSVSFQPVATANSLATFTEVGTMPSQGRVSVALDYLLMEVYRLKSL